MESYQNSSSGVKPFFTFASGRSVCGQEVVIMGDGFEMRTVCGDPAHLLYCDTCKSARIKDTKAYNFKQARKAPQAAPQGTPPAQNPWRYQFEMKQYAASGLPDNRWAPFMRHEEIKRILGYNSLRKMYRYESRARWARLGQLMKDGFSADDLLALIEKQEAESVLDGAPLHTYGRGDREMPTAYYVVPTGPGVYLLQSQGGHFKIGCSGNLKSRVQEIISSMPHETTCIHTIPADEYRDLERSLHRKFRRIRRKGEWFALNTAQVAWVKTLEGYEAGEWIRTKSINGNPIRVKVKVSEEDPE